MRYSIKEGYHKDGSRYVCECDECHMFLTYDDDSSDDSTETRKFTSIDAAKKAAKYAGWIMNGRKLICYRCALEDGLSNEDSKDNGNSSSYPEYDSPYDDPDFGVDKWCGWRVNGEIMTADDAKELGNVSFKKVKNGWVTNWEGAYV